MQWFWVQAVRSSKLQGLQQLLHGVRDRREKHHSHRTTRRRLTVLWLLPVPSHVLGDFKVHIAGCLWTPRSIRTTVPKQTKEIQDIPDASWCHLANLMLKSSATDKAQVFSIIQGLGYRIHRAWKIATLWPSFCSLQIARLGFVCNVRVMLYAAMIL